MGENVSVVIPAFNEQERILQTLEGLRGIDAVSQIIVVDDGSTDSTGELLEDIQDIIFIRNEINRGKGYAVKLALSHVKSSYVALLDADLCQSSSEIKKLIECISPDSRRLVIGKLPAPLKKGGFGIVRRLSDGGFQALTSKRLDSLLSGQRIIPVDFLRSIELPDGFGFEFKVSLEGARQGYELYEVPVEMRHRETGRDLPGFIHRGRQCLDILGLIMKEIGNNRLRS